MNAGRFIAHSRTLRALLELVRRFAATSSNVLISGETRREPVPLTRDVPAALRDYALPGNVGELRHTIERALQIAGSEPIALEHLLPPPCSRRRP